MREIEGGTVLNKTVKRVLFYFGGKVEKNQGRDSS